MAYRRRYNTKPVEMIAKFQSVCGCGKTISRGDQMLYYPASRTAECWECSYATRCALADEDLAGAGVSY